jgi:Carboxypeptidase regulatory-like domain
MLNKNALLVVCVCSLLVCPMVFGQANGSFSGTVVDKTGSVLTSAQVKVTSQGTGVVREAKTDASGHYLIPLLPVATYTVGVQSAGFQAAQQKDIKLQVDEHREVNFTLAPASVTEQVEVSATEVAVQTTNPTLGQVITEQQVADLPLNGRDFVQLATLTPGTTQETNPNSFFNGGPSSEVSSRGTYSLSVGGSRAQSTDWLLDGNDNNELTAGGIAILPSIDAIQEFKVLTYNYSAEYGTRAGPAVLVTTKSGSNQYHGSVFEFFRNTKLDARSFFASTKDKFNLNQFGASFGGPIRKDKTFFFVDYEGKRQRRGIPFNGLVPTPAMVSGNFSQDPYGNPLDATANPLINPYTPPETMVTNGVTTQIPVPFQCNTATGLSATPLADGSQPRGAGTQDCRIIPSSLFDPAGRGMLGLYPAANASNAALGFNYTNVPTRSLDEGKFDIRLDHNFSAKDSAFGRFSYDQAVVFVPGGSPGFAEQNAFGSTQNITNHGRNVAISETHILNDRNINQFNAGFNRIFNHIKSFGDASCESANLGLLGANLNSRCANAPAGLINQSSKDCMSCGLSSTLMGQYWALGDRGFAPFLGGTNVYSAGDTFDMIRGNHNVRVGMQFRAQQMNVSTNGFQDGFLLVFGTHTGDPAADLLLGQFNGAIHDQTFQGAETGRRWKLFRPFVQDDWRVTPNVTLNLGLAWALVTPITEAGDRQANFDFGTGKFLVAGNSPAIAGCAACVHSDSNVGIQMDKTAFEPRIGIAWKPFGSGNTAVRAGYAIFHDSSWNQGAQGLWQNPPYYAEIDNFSGFGPACPLQSLGAVAGCGLRAAFLPAITSQPVPTSFPGTIQSQNLNFKQGMVQQFNINVERQIPGNVVLTAGYAGSRSSHILVDGLNLNVGSPLACDPTSIDYNPSYKLGCAPGGGAFGPRYNPGPFAFAPVIANNNDVGAAHYNSFQVKAETKSTRYGLYALLGYTYSRTYDSGLPDGVGTFPGATYWPLPGTQKLDWGLSQLNLNHQFTASFLYDLPFGKGKHFGSNWSAPLNAVAGGWEVDLIQKATSGFPLFVVDTSNAAGPGIPGSSGVNFQWNGSSLNRPDLVGDPNRAGPVAANPGCSAPSQIHTLTAWFNPCAFAQAAPGELGNAPRAPVSGPRFVNSDLSLIKHFPIRERMMLDFRAEFFNLLNHPQFYLQGSSSVSGMQDITAGNTFGIVNGTVNNPRVIQFALKLNF